MGQEPTQSLDEQTLALSQSMRDYWINFATNHDPNMGVAVNVEWPTFDQNENVLILDKAISTESTAVYGADICSFLDAVGYMAPFTIQGLQASNVLVDTTKGPVQGEVVGNMTAFVGIPFAKPPIGDLRFESPEEPDAWTAPLELDPDFVVRCHQLTANGGNGENNEDCLYLAVYTPLDAKYNETSYQVMVYIHGGAFVMGSGFDLDPQYFMEHLEGLIVVSINYRLGLFGFFYDYDYGTGTLQMCPL